MKRVIAVAVPLVLLVAAIGYQQIQIHRAKTRINALIVIVKSLEGRTEIGFKNTEEEFLRLSYAAKQDIGILHENTESLSEDLAPIKSDYWSGELGGMPAGRPPRP